MNNKLNISIFFLSLLSIILLILFFIKFSETNKLIEKAKVLRVDNNNYLNTLEQIEDSLKNVSTELETARNESSRLNQLLQEKRSESNKLKNNIYLK